MPWGLTSVSLALGALTQLNGVRVVKKNPVVSQVSIGGVPVYNYDARHMLHETSEAAARPFPEEFDWVVVFKPTTSPKTIAEFCGKACRVKDYKRFATFRGTKDLLEKHMTGLTSNIEYVEPDLPVFVIPEVPVTQSAMPTHDGNYFLDLIGLTPNTAKGKDVHVYVVDTGVRTTHSDFGGRAIPTLDTIAGDGTPLECNGDVTCGADTHGHGTHCAGSVGGTKWGVAKEATLHAMKACCGAGTNTLGTLSWIEENAVKPALISMSLGSFGNSMASKTMVDSLVSNGISVFVSAGNNDIDACGKTYAFIESTITVGASDPYDARPWWSNYGSCLDIYAPGLDIISNSNLDDTSDAVMSGTSMATPLTAGAGAVLMGLHPSWTSSDLKTALLEMGAQGVLSNLMDGDPNVRLRV